MLLELLMNKTFLMLIELKQGRKKISEIFVVLSEKPFDEIYLQSYITIAA
jgi:hypothetical protein